MRLIDADALTEKYGDWYVEEGPEDGFIGAIKQLIDTQPTIQPETNCSEIPNNSDTISRQQAIDALKEKVFRNLTDEFYGAMQVLDELPSVQPFHNITMTDVLKYIDDMPEDVWLEFTACLECRGWELQRRTAKWCGGDFA